MPRSFLLAAVCSTHLLLASANAIELYFSDFEEFSAGPDQLVGTDGWLGANRNQGIHGIDDGIVLGLGKTAFLGGSQPQSTFTTVFRPIDYDPLAESTPIIEFETFIGIQDSSNGRRDRFFITFYNVAGEFLAALNFNNTEDSFGIWRLDGINETYTGDVFFRNEVMYLVVRIDFAQNLWSVYIDSVPVFEALVFNASQDVLDLGTVAAEWQLTSPTVTMFGDNWMLFDHWSINAFPDNTRPIDAGTSSVVQIDLDTQRRPTLMWAGEAGFRYQVMYSSDLVHWSSDFPSSLFTPNESPVSLIYTDVTSAGVSRRFYKVTRSAP